MMVHCTLSTSNKLGRDLELSATAHEHFYCRKCAVKAKKTPAKVSKIRRKPCSFKFISFYGYSVTEDWRGTELFSSSYLQWKFLVKEMMKKKERKKKKQIIILFRKQIKILFRNFFPCGGNNHYCNYSVVFVSNLFSNIPRITLWILINYRLIHRRDCNFYYFVVSGGTQIKTHPWERNKFQKPSRSRFEKRNERWPTICYSRPLYDLVALVSVVCSLNRSRTREREKKLWPRCARVAILSQKWTPS